jgi:hypothetical protein
MCQFITYAVVLELLLCVNVKGAKGTVHSVNSMQQYVLHTMSLQDGSLSVGDIVSLSVDEVYTKLLFFIVFLSCTSAHHI